MFNKIETAHLLKKERETLGLTLEEVSSKLGFSNYQILFNIESGKRELKAWELAKLASIYSRSINYFLYPDNNYEEPNILWRNPEKTSQKEEVKNIFLGYCEKYRNILRLLGEKETENRDSLLFPDKNILINKKIDNFGYVANKASEYLDYLKLGIRPACSLAKVLEDKVGIKIVYLDLPEGISGASTFSSDFGMAILINSNDAPWRRNYDLAHEFFHLITWGYFTDEQIYSGSDNKIERLANVFASAFLLPEDEIRRETEKRIQNSKISYLNLIEIAEEFEVSLEALLWRLVNLNLLEKRAVLRELTTGKLKETERKQRNKNSTMNKPYLSSRYISLAIKAFHLGKISKAMLADYVGKKFSDISAFLISRGYREDEDYSVEYSVT